MSSHHQCERGHHHHHHQQQHKANGAIDLLNELITTFKRTTIEINEQRLEQKRM